MAPELDRPPYIPENHPEYIYGARCERVVDGDTIDISIDLGFEHRCTERIRLANVDTRETNFVSHDSEEYERGMVHARFVADWIEENDIDDWDWPLIFYSIEYNRGTYGRLIGDLYGPNTESWLTQDLIDEFDDVEVH